MAKSILITGHEGYIGSMLAPYLRSRGYSVTGLDIGYFRYCQLVEPVFGGKSLTLDVRKARPQDLAGYDAVVHLAALSNDPIGNLNSEWTRDINESATIHLATLAREAGVSRFLFSSSCIMYGGASLGERMVDETCPLDPLTEYARSKVKAEAALGALASRDFSPVYLRNGTVYGLSPRMRFDTVLNSLAGSSVALGKVVVKGDGAPWRPVVHIEDVCHGFHSLLEAPREAVHNEAFNVGADFTNMQIGALARCVAEHAGAALELLSSPGEDQRTYRADFSKIRDRVPKFQPHWTPVDGAKQLIALFRDLNLSSVQFEDPKFTRLRWLRYLMESRQLDEDLNWVAGAERAS